MVPRQWVRRLVSDLRATRARAGLVRPKYPGELAAAAVVGEKGHEERQEWMRGLEKGGAMDVWRRAAAVEAVEGGRTGRVAAGGGLEMRCEICFSERLRWIKTYGRSDDSLRR